MILTRGEQDAIDRKLNILHLEIREYLWSLRDKGEAEAYLERTKEAHNKLKAIVAEEDEDAAVGV